MFAEISDGHRRKQPHHYLGVIGVRTDARAARDPSSAGVGLDTENPKNLSLYEDFGYQVLATDKVEDIDSWCMFRPNAGG